MSSDLPFHGRTLSASLTVRDLRTSLAWYRDVVGFTVDREIEREGELRAVALSAGDVRILINQDDGARGPDRVRGEGFSLMITTDQSVDRVAARIRERGGTLESEPADMPWGARAFRLRDAPVPSGCWPGAGSSSWAGSTSWASSAASTGPCPGWPPGSAARPSHQDRHELG